MADTVRKFVEDLCEVHVDKTSTEAVRFILEKPGAGSGLTRWRLDGADDGFKPPSTISTKKFFKKLRHVRRKRNKNRQSRLKLSEVFESICKNMDNYCVESSEVYRKKKARANGRGFRKYYVGYIVIAPRPRSLQS
mmetsp:Transcript_12566/g.24351  ORF Transcript_12566/g.24351 Transcript_12566/m.24351 type:complete len:136 (+) Transcript_12566:103-510(+)